MIRVCIADDHAVVRAGVKSLLADTTDLVLQGEASTVQELFDLVAAEQCDVVLLDVSFPGRNGIEALAELKRLASTLPVLMFSVHPEHQYAVRAFKAGAAGYLTKESASAELLIAVRKVAQGGYYITPAVAERLAIETARGVDRPLHSTLTNREYQVLIGLASGKTVTHIADQLALSVKTVSTYRMRLLKKMHMHTNAELIYYAISQRLVP
jgi:DNA-binding NarL/FixJ family response regulator